MSRACGISCVERIWATAAHSDASRGAQFISRACSCDLQACGSTATENTIETKVWTRATAREQVSTVLKVEAQVPVLASQGLDEAYEPGTGRLKDRNPPSTFQRCTMFTSKLSDSRTQVWPSAAAISMMPPEYTNN